MLVLRITGNQELSVKRDSCVTFKGSSTAQSRTPLFWDVTPRRWVFHDVSKESYRLHLRGNHSPSDVASHPRKKGKTGIQSLLFAVGVEANSLAHRYQKPTQQNTSAEHTVLSVYKFSRAKFLHTWNTHARSHTHSVCGLRSHNRIMGPR